MVGSNLRQQKVFIWIWVHLNRSSVCEFRRLIRLILTEYPYYHGTDFRQKIPSSCLIIASSDFLKKLFVRRYALLLLTKFIQLHDIFILLISILFHMIDDYSFVYSCWLFIITYTRTGTNLFRRPCLEISRKSRNRSSTQHHVHSSKRSCMIQG